jgi:hypothetical protein
MWEEGGRQDGRGAGRKMGGSEGGRERRRLYLEFHSGPEPAGSALRFQDPGFQDRQGILPTCGGKLWESQPPQRRRRSGRLLPPAWESFMEAEGILEPRVLEPRNCCIIRTLAVQDPNVNPN